MTIHYEQAEVVSDRAFENATGEYPRSPYFWILLAYSAIQALLAIADHLEEIAVSMPTQR